MHISQFGGRQDSHNMVCHCFRPAACRRQPAAQTVGNRSAVSLSAQYACELLAIYLVIFYIVIVMASVKITTRRRGSSSSSSSSSSAQQHMESVAASTKGYWGIQEQQEPKKRTFRPRTTSLSVHRYSCPANTFLAVRKKRIALPRVRERERKCSTNGDSSFLRMKRKWVSHVDVYTCGWDFGRVTMTTVAHR